MAQASAPGHIPVIVNKDQINVKALPFPKNEVVYIERPQTFAEGDAINIALTPEPAIMVGADVPHYNLRGLTRSQLLNLCKEFKIPTTVKDTVATLKEKLNAHESTPA